MLLAKTFNVTMLAKHYATESMPKMGLGMQFEYMTPCTPQYKWAHGAQIGICFGLICLMLNQSKVQGAIQKGGWAKAGGTATLINIYIVTGTKRVAP
jgi:hypothetical protein